MATVITSAGTAVAPSGRPSQSHLIYAENSATWWLFWVDGGSLTTLRTASSPDGTTWTTRGTFTLASSQDRGSNVAVAYKNISSTDVVHIGLCYYVSASQQRIRHVRATISGTTITFGSENQVNADMATFDSNNNESGVALTLSSDNYPHMTQSLGEGSVNYGWSANSKASNADTGSSWTAGWAAAFSLQNGPNYNNHGILIPLASGTVLWVGTDMANYQVMANLTWQQGTTWNTIFSGTVYASNFSSQDQNDWHVVKVSNTAVHAVARTGTNTYSHRIFNGTSWSNGASITNQNSKAGAGLFMASDGTDVWLFVVDSDAANTIRYIKYTTASGTWGSWTALVTTTKTRTFLSGYPAVSASAIGLIWSEVNGSNKDIAVEYLSLGGGTPTHAGSANLTAAPILTGQGASSAVGHAGQAALIGRSTLVGQGASSAVGHAGSTSLTAAPSLIAQGASIVSATGQTTLTASHILQAQGSAAATSHTGQTTLTAGSTPSGQGTSSAVPHAGQASLAAASTLQAQGSATATPHAGHTNLSAAPSLVAQGASSAVAHPGQAALVAASLPAAQGGSSAVGHAGQSSLSAASTLSAQGTAAAVGAVSGQANFTAQSTISASGASSAVGHAGQSSLSAASSLTAEGASSSVAHAGQTALTAQSTLIAQGSAAAVGSVDGQASLTAQSSLSSHGASSSVAHAGQALLTAGPILSAQGSSSAVVHAGEASLSAGTTLQAQGSVANAGAVDGQTTLIAGSILSSHGASSAVGHTGATVLVHAPILVAQGDSGAVVHVGVGMLIASPSIQGQGASTRPVTGQAGLTARSVLTGQGASTTAVVPPLTGPAQVVLTDLRTWVLLADGSSHVIIG